MGQFILVTCVSRSICKGFAMKTAQRSMYIPVKEKRDRREAANDTSSNHVHADSPWLARLISYLIGRNSHAVHCEASSFAVTSDPRLFHMRAKVQLVIDTDGVSDDIRAISLAMQHPDVEVLAFTTVHGCVSVEQATANVARCQRANEVQKPIPIYKGAAEPLLGRENDFCSENIFFGKDGIGDQPNAFPEVLPSDFVPTSEEVAALALIRIAKENPEATLVCLGPLTNIALALKIDPNFAFSKVFVMGGNYYGIGNVESKSSAEFNFHGDPEAASIVLRKLASRIVVIPWEAFFIEGVKHEKEVDFNAHLQYDTKLASFLGTATSIGRAALAKNGRQFSYCDEIAVAAAIDLNRVARKFMHLRVNVELAGTHTRSAHP
ncbi:hypothetical protein Y032_0014g2206 [Ancylostoma ceylanicum]|uniref:Inosine/uridine-preferring nucleoside hydrolase domain-containing protein n=2 Tax=Ancylostoma ceylanicum TaxID=53326 RepID=A0A016V9E3_9BILA|nr:hypothetical protein Y032_0014g2206 [Ancylostoma ceylanicum]